MKKLFLTALLITSLFFTSACGNDSTSTADNETKIFATVEDSLGEKIILKDKPEKIVVTSASFLEPLHAVGANIAGRPDSKNKMPDWAKNIPSVGQVYQIDIEKLLACQPDLVIVNKGINEKILNVLKENKIPALVIEMKTYDEVKDAIKIFSQLSGNVEEGNKLVEKMDEDIQKILNEVPKEKKRAAILHGTAQGLTVQLDGSIAGDILKMFGWENVASGMTPLEKNPDAAPYSMETLAEQNPEIIFVTSMGNVEEIKASLQESINSNEAWQTIQAIKNNQIYYLPQNLFLLSPGLDYPEAVKFMAKQIYPNLNL